MKTYTLVLDIVIVLLMAFAAYLSISDDVITNTFVRHNGMTRTTVICWQTMVFISSFCLFLRYIARTFA